MSISPTEVTPFYSRQLDTTALVQFCKRESQTHPVMPIDYHYFPRRYFAHHHIQVAICHIAQIEQGIRSIFNERVLLEKSLERFCNNFQGGKVASQEIKSCLETLDKSRKHNTYNRLQHSLKILDGIKAQHPCGQAFKKNFHQAIEKTKKSLQLLGDFGIQENNIEVSLSTYTEKLDEKFTKSAQELQTLEQQAVQALRELDEEGIKHIGKAVQSHFTEWPELLDVIKEIKASKEVGLGQTLPKLLQLAERHFLKNTQQLTLFNTDQNTIWQALRHIKHRESFKKELDNPGAMALWENWFQNAINNVKKVQELFINYQPCLQPVLEWEKALEPNFQACQEQNRVLKDRTINMLRVGINSKKDLGKAFEAAVVAFIHSSASFWNFRNAIRKNTPRFVPGRELKQKFSIRFLPDGNFECYATHSAAYPILGQGSFKTARYAFSTRIGRMATVSARDAKVLQKELNNLRKVKGHPSFVELLEVLPEYIGKGGGNKIRINLELCSGTSLQRALSCNQFTFEQSITFVRQIAEGCRFLHDTLRMLHRDLKPGNIFITKNWDAKIGDMGSACLIFDSHSILSCNSTTAVFASPEYVTALAKKESLVPVTTPELDLWSLACIFWSLFAQKDMPWYTDQGVVKATSDYWQEVKRKYTHGATASRDLIKEPKIFNLMAQLMEFDPQKRLSANQVCTYLDEHFPEIVPILTQLTQQ